jgi:uncharacterized protein YdeI (YjbR/CyaY-like superfamily)
MKPDYETIAFESPDAWRQWLALHHEATDGIWMRLYKKASGVATVSYAEALDQALCYGWIDGQKKSLDQLSFLQKFTPRRKNSLWSKRNIEHVARLSTAGLMTPAGQGEVDRARADGRWEAAYDMASTMTVPDDFLAELEKRPQAKEFFATLNKANTYAIAWRLQTAKTDATRLRRQDKLLAMLEAGEKLY